MGAAPAIVARVASPGRSATDSGIDTYSHATALGSGCQSHRPGLATMPPKDTTTPTAQSDTLGFRFGVARRQARPLPRRELMQLSAPNQGAIRYRNGIARRRSLCGLTPHPADLR